MAELTTSAPRAAPPFVSLDDVSLAYGGLPAIADTSLTIRDGEFVAVVGPSGCGKPSLLKLVSGLHPAAAGTVQVDGRPVTGPLNLCGIAFQNAHLLPWRTALANILLPLEIVKPHRRSFQRERRRHEERARALLATVGLAGAEDRHIWELSGGMQQRVSLCRALIHEPRLRLLDEPFGALDAFTREDLWRTLQDLWLDRKPMVILVTHDLREAAFLADTIYVFGPRPGRIVHRTEVAFARPRNPETSTMPAFNTFVHALRAHIART